VRSTKREVALLIACAAILAWQLILPGFIGLANNRDFAKVAGRLCIGREDVPSSYYVYVHADFERAQRYCWNSQIPASEAALATAASSVEQRLSDPARFDIRWLGAIHAIVFLAAWWILLRALRPLQGVAWWIAVSAALWMFTDVSYVAYLNSFYTDASAILGAMILLASALWTMQDDSKLAPVLWFGAGTLLFVMAKPQHACLAPVLAILLITRRPRIPVILFTVAMLALAAWTGSGMPSSYKAQARFDVVFSKILLTSPNPAKDVEELGLRQDDLPLIGQHAFLPSSPAFDPAWLDEFSRRSSYIRVARFWLRHPWRTIDALRADLATEAWRRRPAEFSNFQPDSGKPPGALTSHFGSWSDLQTRISHAWPTSNIVWYALVFLFAAIRLKSTAGFPAALVKTALLAAIIAVIEFVIASLTEARETDRHLTLFHLFTDWTMLLAMTYFLYSRSSASIRG
jgi:hypothetical protein